MAPQWPCVNYSRFKGSSAGCNVSQQLNHNFTAIYLLLVFIDDVPLEENEIAHEKWCNDLSAKLLCVLVLDRFGDFVTDQVIAPVREMVSQTLASLLIHMPRRSVLHVHSILLQMTQQAFAIPPTINSNDSPKAKSKVKEEKEQKAHIWEIRHAGLLGIKYEVAVRSDLFDSGVVKQEDGEDESGRQILRDVVDAAVLG